MLSEISRTCFLTKEVCLIAITAENTALIVCFLVNGQLLNAYSDHGLDDMQLIKKFYNGLNVSTAGPFTS